jgi:hypothetical protein
MDTSKVQVSDKDNVISIMLLITNPIFPWAKTEVEDNSLFAY